jgi:hypothetical protein
MIISDFPKLPQQPQYVVEKSITSISPVPEKKKNPFNEPVHQAENFGGLFVGATGPAGTASTVSPSQSPESVSFIPEVGPLPEVEMKKQQLGENMEIITYPNKNKIG